MTEHSASLDDIRSDIDALDREIVGLLAKRQRCVVAAGALKTSGDGVRDPARVERVIEKVRGLAVSNGADSGVVEATYRAMISAFIDLEMRVHLGNVSDDTSV